MSLPTIGMLADGYCGPFLSKPYGSVKVGCFVSDFSFDRVIKGSKRLADVSLEIKQTHEESGVAYHHVLGSRSTATGEKLRGDFIALQDGSSLFLATGHPTRYVDQVMKHIVNRLYPDVVRIYLTSYELRNTLGEFSSSMKVELHCKRFVAKSMFGRPFTDIQFEKAMTEKELGPYSFAFDEAKRRKAWIDGIRVSSIGRVPYDFWVTRSGILKYYRGNFHDFYRTILRKFAAVGLGKRRMFEKRGRVDQPNRQVVKPLLIRFESEIFDDLKSRRELVNTISHYQLCTYSVVHEGNPHIYVSIMDRGDNSSFALRTYRSDSLLLIPQIRTSHASLMRFSKFLLDNFREGELSEFSD